MRKWLKPLLIFYLIVGIPSQMGLWFALYCRTKVADYDVKLVHYKLEYNYCPYCGKEIRLDTDNSVRGE